MPPKPTILHIREPFLDAAGRVSRTWYRFLDSLTSGVGATSEPLVVQDNAILVGGTVSSGGTITSPDLPPSTLIGNGDTIAAAPTTIGIDPSLSLSGDILSIAPLPPRTLMGNSASELAPPGAIIVGSNLSLAGSVLSATGDEDDETLLYSIRDTRGEIADLQRQVNDALVLAMLSPPSEAASAASIIVNPDSLFGNAGIIASTGTSIAVGGGLSLSATGTLSAIGVTSAIYAPLVNGDLPGPTLIADPYGQCIMVEIR